MDIMDITVILAITMDIMVILDIILEKDLQKLVQIMDTLDLVI